MKTKESIEIKRKKITKWPKVAIIILNWNGWKDTIECLESLKKITYPNYEVIVIDNGSKGNDADILEEKYKDYIEVIKNKENLGFAGGFNLGVNKLKLRNDIDYFLLLNNDTTVTPDFLNKLTEFIEANPEVGVASPLIFYYHQRNKVYSCGGKLNSFLFSCKFYKFSHKEPQKNLNFISGCAPLVRKSLVEKIGLFDENFFTYWEETDFCLRAKKTGFSIACVPQSIIYHKVAQSNKYLSKRYIYYMVRNNLLLAKKHAKWYQWPFLLINFFLRNWVGYFLKLIFTKSYSAIPSIFLGTKDFILGRYGRGSV